jgi:hypothetical protein
MELLSKQIGSEGQAKVEISGGKLSLVALFDSKGLDGEVKLSVDADYFMDELAKKIPGQLDDAVLAILKGALKAL